jgi:hypothetical protein
MVLPDFLGETTKGAAGLGEATVQVFGDRCVVGDNTPKIREVLYCVQAGALDVDLRWDVCYMGGLVDAALLSSG